MHELDVIILWNDEKMINESQEFDEDNNSAYRINLLQSAISDCISKMERSLERGIEVIVSEQGRMWLEQKGRLEIVVMVDHGEFVRVGGQTEYPIKLATRQISYMSIALLRSLDNLHNKKFDRNTRFIGGDKKFTGFEN